MKVNYLVIFDDAVETYCATIKDVTETIDEMVEMYCCDALPEKTLRKNVEVYKVSKVKV